MDKIQKPITVARAEFVSNLADLINNSGLPAFVIESILKDMLYDVRTMCKKQLELDTKKYQEMLAASDDINHVESCNE